MNLSGETPWIFFRRPWASGSWPRIWPLSGMENQFAANLSSISIPTADRAGASPGKSRFLGAMASLSASPASRGTCKSPAALQSDMAALSVVLDHIRENLDQPLHLPELAAMAGLSTYQLDQRIRSLFGISAGQYVARARIELACNRLRQTDQPISRIALDCGYADQAAFARQFRRSTGLTPDISRRVKPAPWQMKLRQNIFLMHAIR